MIYDAFDKLKNVDWMLLFLHGLLVLVVVVAIIVTVPAIQSITNRDNIEYIETRAAKEFQRRDAIVQECLNSERYTRQECITLAGGNNE